MIEVAGFETARMRAEPIAPRHRDGLIALLGDERVGATLGGVATPTEVDAQIGAQLVHWRDHGFGWYAFLDRATGALIARGGPGHCHVAGNDEVEIGWTVAPARWNEGLATELGAASIDVAFGPLGLPDVVSFTLRHNHASRRVMEKLGFAYERDTDYKGWEHVLYRLSAARGGGDVGLGSDGHRAQACRTATTGTNADRPDGVRAA